MCRCSNDVYIVADVGGVVPTVNKQEAENAAREAAKLDLVVGVLIGVAVLGSPGLLLWAMS